MSLETRTTFIDNQMTDDETYEHLLDDQECILIHLQIEIQSRIRLMDAFVEEMRSLETKIGSELKKIDEKRKKPRNSSSKD